MIRARRAGDMLPFGTLVASASSMLRAIGESGQRLLHEAAVKRRHIDTAGYRGAITSRVRREGFARARAPRRRVGDPL